MIALGWRRVLGSQGHQTFCHRCLNFYTGSGVTTRRNALSILFVLLNEKACVRDVAMMHRRTGEERSAGF